MTPTATNPGIRKAAIFVAGLDRATADLVLDQMQDEEAQAVRQAIMDLEPADMDEQRAVVAEFHRRRSESASASKPREAAPASEARKDLSPTAAVEAGLARKFVPPSLTRPAAKPSSPRPSAPPFQFLCDAEADKLAHVLATERPQTIALVLSHMPPRQAGSVLARLEPGLQVDVVHRLVDLEETDPEILREVERGLQTRLSEQVQMQRRRVAGLAAVTGILDACDHAAGAQILDNLSARDKPLAQRLAPEPMEEVQVAFDDLLGMADESLAVTLRAADPEWVLLALVGAPPAWIDRFLDLIPASDAQSIRNELAHLGPTRLSDVEEARLRLAELARDLATEGRIQLPEQTRLLAEVG